MSYFPRLWHQGSSPELWDPPSIHHFDRSETVGPWPQTMGWLSFLWWEIIPIVSQPATFANVKSSMQNCNSSDANKHQLLH